MTAHAEGTFLLKGWDESTIQELDDGSKITRARIEQDFSGDLEGSGVWDSVMSYLPDGTAEYVGYQRIEGSASRYRGFKCPHCRLFVPYERAEERALVERVPTDVPEAD